GGGPGGGGRRRRAAAHGPGRWAQPRPAGGSLGARAGGGPRPAHHGPRARLTGGTGAGGIGRIPTESTWHYGGGETDHGGNGSHDAVPVRPRSAPARRAYSPGSVRGPGGEGLR